MQLPRNAFKAALREGRQQIGLWCSLGDPAVAELLAGSGFDWIVFDTEHSPNDDDRILAQLQAAAPYGVSAVARPAANDPVRIKRLLDIGAQTLVVPYVQDAGEAAAAVAAMRYAPEGIRGVSGVTRATRWGRIPGYATTAAEELCLIVQVESQMALDNIETIASVEGVDGIFIGPADLAASLGHPGNPGHLDVMTAIEEAIRRIVRAGKPAGILTADRAQARACIGIGTTFTAVGMDAQLLARAADALVADFATLR